MLYSYRMTSMVPHIAQYHRQHNIPLNRAGDCSYAQYNLDDKYSIRPGFEPSTLNQNLTK